MKRMRWVPLLAAVVALVGCSKITSRTPAAPPVVVDAGTPDAGHAVPVDMSAIDAGRTDAGNPFGLPPVITSRDPADYKGPLVEPGVDLNAPREIVVRGCELYRFGDSIVLEPGVFCPVFGCRASIECTRPEDCHDGAYPRCLGLELGRCDYGDGSVEGAECVADTDCAVNANGRCVGVLHQTVCQYNNQCEVDADCPNSEHCDCGSSGDRVCVEVDCRKNEDCPATQSCRRSNPCNFGPYGDYRCTTPQDECVPYSETGCACDYDREQRRWVCTDVICD